MEILTKRGFCVVEPPNLGRDIDAVGRDLIAINPDGTVLHGSSPIVLLGLLSIVDHLGPDWYTDPRPEFKEIDGKWTDVIDLDPEILEEIKDHEIEQHIEGFKLMCDCNGFSIDPGNTRESLVIASRKYLELDEERERRAQED